jgi:drug/metabolite transporter (DMT)-like permease
MFSLLIALALGNEQFMLLRTLGIMMGVTAMILIAVPEASLPKPELAPWLLVALIAPLCYGLEANYIALRAPRDIYPIAALYGASVIGAFIAGPIAWASGHWVDLFKPWEAAEWALLGASTGHAIAYSGYMWLVGLAGVVFTSQIAYIVTAAAIASSILFLGESYSAWIWCAVFAMLGGLMLVQPVGELPRSRNV